MIRRQSNRNLEGVGGADRPSSEELEPPLRQSTEVIRSLSARLLRVQDEERRRIARELHDSTGQTLTVLKIELANLQERLRCGHADSADFAHLNALADEALRDIRTTSHLLFPPLLEEIGFCPAAKWYIEGFSQRSNIRVILHLASIDRLPRLIETALFRVLQESLTNIYRHSSSKVVDVRIGQHVDRVILEVQDYGRGIPSTLLERFKRTGTGVGVGLAGMRERMDGLGGHLEILSTTSGTRIRAIVPAQDQAPSPDENPDSLMSLAA